MIIEQERDDSIIYSEATDKDFDRTVELAHILRGKWADLERVKVGTTKQELYRVHHDYSGTHKLLIAELDRVEQELTVYF